MSIGLNHHDTDAGSTKMKDGRTQLAHKAEPAEALATGLGGGGDAGSRQYGE